MVVVKVSCTACDAEVNLPGTAISLLEYDGRCTYAFQCPRCKARVVRDAEKAHRSLLVSSGIKPRVIVPYQRDAEPAGPPINSDDEIAFGLEIEALP